MKYKDTSGSWASQASFLFTPSKCPKIPAGNGMELGKKVLPRESVQSAPSLAIARTVFFFSVVQWGYLDSRASLLHPSPSLLTNSLYQALPQAAPCNYSPMSQTGEMGVCYTVYAELRKTTGGPLFVNQTQGQNKMLSGTSSLLVIIENCEAKDDFCWFPFLFIYLLTFIIPTFFPDLFCYCYNIASSSHRMENKQLFLYLYL